MLRITHYLIATVALLALVLVSAWFASPWLVAQLAPRFAQTLGVDALWIYTHLHRGELQGFKTGMLEEVIGQHASCALQRDA